MTFREIRSVGRTIYADDSPIGVMESAEIATHVIDAMRFLAWVEGQGILIRCPQCGAAGEIRIGRVLDS